MTSVSELFPSRFLKAADLKGRTVKVKIKKVEVEEIGQDKDEKPVIYFEGVERGLVMNKTNGVAIADIHGDVTGGWTGKEIEIFSMMVPYQGQNVAAIRIRAVAEPAVPAVAEPVAPTPAATADPNDAIGI